MRYGYTLVFEDDAYTAQFVDLPNIITYGETAEDAHKYAKEALDASLECDVSRGFQLPEPSGAGEYFAEVAAYIEVADMLRKLRGERSQGDVAKLLGISYQAYQRLENPRKGNPSVKTLEKVAQVFGKRLTIQVA